MGIKARGLGGVEWEFDYPLKPEIELQIKNGTLKVVERTGEDARPDVTASREAWIKYLDDVHDIDPDSLKEMSKPNLIKEAARLDKESGRGS
jgi:hypothetical protein